MAATGRKASDTSKKRRERRTFLAADTEADLEFMELEIRKYCPKRIFDIIVINAEDDISQEQILNIIDSFREYEDMSSVTFIKYTEVIALVDTFDYSIFPAEVRPILETVLEETRMYVSIKKIDKLTTLKMAVLMKIKLMEVMIKHYKREMDIMQTRKVLIEELDNLTKIDKKNMSRRDSLRRFKMGTEPSQIENLDTESDVIFDDDIYNHVWFYAFEGIYNSKVLSMLLAGKVPITAIIKVDSLVHSYNLPDSTYSRFWAEMDELLYSHIRSEIFENTMLMQFTIEGEEDQDIFQNFLHTVKYISEIKFQHLNYIRHIQIYEMDSLKNHIPLHCMHTYNKLMSNIPVELVSEVVVLSSVLEEICFQMDGDNINDKYSILDLPRTSPQGTRANCPNLYVSNQHQSEPLKKPPDNKTPTNFQSYQCYHRDILSKILNMYKPSGKLVYNLSLNVMKCMHPFNLLDDMMACERNQPMHKHDIAPSTKLSKNESEEVFNHFLNLFVFCTFQYNEIEEQPPRKEKFTEKLLTYDHVAFCNKFRTTLDEKGKKNSELYFDLSYNINPMDFYWIESYPSFILMQEILNTQNQFSYVDTTYCPETDRVLVQFCDWLDEFGLNTRIYHETLITPVCLRDFCRYTANEISNWIKDNPPPKYVRKSEQAEICKGARNIKNVDMFEDYRYLLETESMPVADSGSKISHFADAKLTTEVTFDQMMNELETYPQNLKLKEEYTKQGYSKDFLAYDFGTKYFALRGGRTIFASHDGIKIYVDSCKFIDENDKCTVSLQYRNNILILHSSENFRTFYSCHWILDNETIVVFEIQKKRPKVSKIDIETSPQEDKLETVPVDPKIDISKMKVKYKSMDSDMYDLKLKDDRDPINLYEGVNEAIKHNCPMYKSNKAYTTLKPIKTEEISVATVLQRILHNVKTNIGGEGESGQARSKRFVPNRAPNVTVPVIESAIFRLTLPNGIHVTCYPSLVKEPLVEVKQELLSPHIDTIKNEEFRLFTREGYILIKKTDGTITILMSNGNKIDFEKPNTDKGIIKSSNLKPVHCKTVNDYRKKLNQLMKDAEKTNDDYYISRRGVLETKRGYIINEDFIKILESTKLPYLKTSLLNFDGTKTVLEGNKISQKKLYYTIAENDFCEEEIFYERKDGFKCILHRTATKTIEYPDGTRITTSVLVANELVDGYVYITLFYKYEHPHYATVSYSDGDLLQVILDSLVIEKSKNLCTLKIDPETKCTVDSDLITFEKTCQKCNIPFNCTFDISPFHNNFFEFAKQFVHAEDSYMKHFFVDFSGICRVNKNYIVGPVNRSNCNHVETNTYKKLYALRKTMSGEEFFTDNMINSYVDDVSKKDYVTIVKTGNTNPILRLQYNYYQPFNERLLNKSVIHNAITLMKYNKKKEKTLSYSTIKVISQIVNAKNIQMLLSYLSKQLYHVDIDEHTLRLIQWLADKKEDEAELKMLEALIEKENLMAEQAKYCKCVKDKRTFARKILQWREEYAKLKKILKEGKIPMYFDSEFCQKIKRRR